jgi:hypothetical protein
MPNEEHEMLRILRHKRMPGEEHSILRTLRRLFHLPRRRIPSEGHEILRLLDGLLVLDEQTVRSYKRPTYDPAPFGIVDVPPCTRDEIRRFTVELLERSRPNSYFTTEGESVLPAFVVISYQDNDISEIFRFYRVGQDRYVRKGVAYAP